MTYLAIAGALFIAWVLFASLFTPAIPYHTRRRVDAHAPDFLRTILSTCQARMTDGNKIAILSAGNEFYGAMLDAIRAAEHTINMECYIFRPGRIAERFIEALVERAHAGVAVKVVVDAIGSSGLWGEPADRLREAGILVASYQPIKWYSLARLNNRTHREVLVVDGRVAFVGGAGIADWWVGGDGEPAWRDTVARVEGPVVADLQGVFVENWLGCCGEILIGPEHFPPLEPAGGATAFIVRSSPADRSTASRVAFQLLVEGAMRRLSINTPYFLPDKWLRQALVDSASRGVEIHVIVPGRRTDQRWVRLASRRLYGELLEAGVRLFEYRRAMMHAKVLIADENWAVLGSTNFDNRSFEHNDEVNLLVREPAIAAKLLEDHERDLADSREVTLDDWRRRPLWERGLAPFIWLLERQQ